MNIEKKYRIVKLPITYVANRYDFHFDVKQHCILIKKKHEVKYERFEYPQYAELQTDLLMSGIKLSKSKLYDIIHFLLNQN